MPSFDDFRDRSEGPLPKSFWWRFWPLFFAVTTPPVGIDVSCVAWFKAPTDCRNTTLFSLLTSVALTVLAASVAIS